MENNKTHSLNFSSGDLRNYCVPASLFFSGFTALVFEICCIRRNSLVFGSTLYAVGTIVSIYFAGLAAGSYFFGKRCDRTPYPLRQYAVLECCIALFCLITPLLFRVSDVIYGVFYPYLAQNPISFNLARILLIAAVLFFPTFCMGGALPLAIRYFTGEKESGKAIQKPDDYRQKILFSIGSFYGINTTGGVFGCLICGFILIPHIGVTQSIRLCAFISLCIAILLYYLKFPPVAITQKTSAPVPHTHLQGKTENSAAVTHLSANREWLLKWLFFSIGLASIGNEMIWTRYLSLIIHNTVYTYTITLTVILVGIVIGSILISRLRQRFYPSLSAIFAIVQICTGFYIAALLRVPHTFWYAALDTQNTLTILWICSAIMFIPSLLSGISFPIAVRMAVKKTSDTGTAVGLMSAYNIGGGICGSLIFAFFLLPFVGLQMSILLSSALSMLVGLLGVFFLAQPARARLIRVTALSAVLLWAGLAFTTRERLPADFLSGNNRLLYFKEGQRSFIAVLQDAYNNTVLEIDRLWQGEVKNTHQVMAAHVPMLLHPNPHSVCVIGLGAGQTAREFLRWNVRAVDVVDIEESLPDICKTYFRGSWLTDTRVTVVVEDGRTYLSHARRMYDVISIEIGQLFRSQCAPFYTLEFYQSVKKRLAPEGLVCQFVPLLLVGHDQFLGIIRTFLEVFPHSVLWYNDSELLLIGSTESQPKLTRQRFEECLQNRALADALTFSYWGGTRNQVRFPDVFTAGFLCGPGRLRTLTAGHALYSDDKPVLEYASAHYQINSSDTLIRLITMLKEVLDPFGSITPHDTQDTLYKKSPAIREQNLRNVLAVEYFKRYLTTKDPNALSMAYTLNPSNLGIILELGLVYERNNDLQNAECMFKSILEFDTTHSQAYNNLGLLQLEKGALGEAMRLYALSIRYDSSNTNAYLNMGVAWMQAKNMKEASRSFEKALQINPNNANAQEMLLTLKRRGF